MQNRSEFLFSSNNFTLSVINFINAFLATIGTSDKIIAGIALLRQLNYSNLASATTAAAMLFYLNVQRLTSPQNLLPDLPMASLLESIGSGSPLLKCNFSHP